MILKIMFLALFVAKIFNFNDYNWIIVFLPIIVDIIVEFISKLFDYYKKRNEIRNERINKKKHERRMKFEQFKSNERI